MVENRDAPMLFRNIGAGALVSVDSPRTAQTRAMGKCEADETLRAASQWLQRLHWAKVVETKLCSHSRV